jgi:AraC family transcriptional regulator, regulatory protein of adaptative response / methylated-DNA-[protein]-cysteine methyltransferase
MQSPPSLLSNNVELLVVPAAHPSRYGAGLTIHYGLTSSPFGSCFVAVCGLGICYLGFPQASQQSALQDLLRQEWPEADLIEDPNAIAILGKSIFQLANNHAVKVVLKGTDFQISVWNALLGIPAGCTTNYTDIAQQIKKPKAVRAVGTAIGKNPVSYLVPCHRVVPKNGGTGNYLWGSECKAKILRSEAAMPSVK